MQRRLYGRLEERSAFDVFLILPPQLSLFTKINYIGKCRTIPFFHAAATIALRIYNNDQFTCAEVAYVGVLLLAVVAGGRLVLAV